MTEKEYDILMKLKATGHMLTVEEIRKMSAPQVRENYAWIIASMADKH